MCTFLIDAVRVHPWARVLIVCSGTGERASGYVCLAFLVCVCVFVCECEFAGPEFSRWGVPLSGVSRRRGAILLHLHLHLQCLIMSLIISDVCL